jgi:hypothetical protein
MAGPTHRNRELIGSSFAPAPVGSVGRTAIRREQIVCRTTACFRRGGSLARWRRSRQVVSVWRELPEANIGRWLPKPQAILTGLERTTFAKDRDQQTVSKPISPAFASTPASRGGAGGELSQPFMLLIVAGGLSFAADQFADFLL